jgi:hypothetical protein
LASSSICFDRAALEAEILVLRQQIIVLRRRKAIRIDRRTAARLTSGAETIGCWQTSVLGKWLLRLKSR